MNYVMLINAAVSLIMGCALVLVWRRDPAQSFTRFIGWANLVQLLVPLIYVAKSGGASTADTLGNFAMMVVAAVYSTLLLRGTAELAGRAISKPAVWGVLTALAVVNVAAVALGGPRLGQAAMGTVNTALGLICAYWLWKSERNSSVSEKLVGPLLVLLGLIQFTYVVYQDQGAALLATAGALLRLLLGLVLLVAALDRSAVVSRKLQARFERLAERSRQGIMICLGEDSIVYANRACLDIYGVDSLEQLRIAVVARTIPRAERVKVGRILSEIQHGQEDDANYEALRHRADGTPLWLRFHYFRTEWDGASAVQILISDETERHQASQALVYQSMHDELTGLPNRASMIQSLRQRCGAVEVSGRFVLVLMNIDRFKLFNEAHGPSMGDEVLKTMGQALRTSMNSECEVMRLAGDEFALIESFHEGADTAVDMVTRVRSLLARPLLVAGQEFFLDASLGIALYPSSARDAESLLRAANAAMHVAKRTPGTSYRLAEKAFERGSSNALEQEQALRAGIERGEFYLAYQPKVDALSGRLTSLEALARWRRSDTNQFVSPMEFIAAAERTGLISVLGTALLRQACHQIADWLQEFGACVPVAVNVSPLQLLDPRFPAVVAQTLQDCGVGAQWLTLEITESSAVQNLDQTMLQVEQLRALGVHVAMDDFGTGFSSLNMLRNLRLHTVKIDRGLIDPLPAHDAVAVVRAICQLSDALHLHVVAEGVESAAQADAARGAGCGELQGYLYSRPLPAKDVGVWLQRLDARYADEDMEISTQSVKLGE